MTLRANGLTKEFGNLVAVDAVDLHVDSGEILGLVGPNGAGKTTTFNLLTGVMSPTAGTIVLQGEDVTTESASVRANRGIIRTFQENRTFSTLTVEENVQLGSYPQTGWRERPQDEIVESVLGKVNLLDRRELQSQHLSHGELRRLQVAMGIAAEPVALLLDEPTAGLTGQETKDVMSLVSDLADEGVAVVVVEHDIDTIMTYSDRIIVLNNGNKLAEGEPSAIQKDERVIEAYLGGVEFA